MNQSYLPREDKTIIQKDFTEGLETGFDYGASRECKTKDALSFCLLGKTSHYNLFLFIDDSCCLRAVCLVFQQMSELSDVTGCFTGGPSLTVQLDVYRSF